MLALNQIKEKFNNLTEMKYFDELYALSLALIALLGWSINTILGMAVLIIVAAIAMLLTNNMKYAIPSIIYIVFTINEGFSNEEIPIPLVITASVFVTVLVIYVFKNGFGLKKMYHTVGLAGLALTNLLPIFWANNIPNENSVFYIFFFADLAYLILYIIVSNGIKGDSLNLLSNTMIYLGILLTFECLINVIERYDSADSIFKIIYYFGWGVCNEAAILICMAIPFAFYLIGKSSSYSFISIGHIKIILLFIGAVLTTSRAGVIFASVEIVLLYIFTYFMAINKSKYKRVSICFMTGYLLMGLIFIVPLYRLVYDIIENLFSMGFNGNGRLKLWKEAFEIWSSNPRNIILGPGITSVLRVTYTPNGYQIGMIVFHSTLLETLVVGGIFSILFLVIHMIQKYLCIYKIKDKLFFVLMLIGFIVVDLYGMIDNTYHMFYYMIPLMVILACIDNVNFNSSNEESVYNEQVY